MGNRADFFLNPEQRGKARAPQLPYVIDADVCAYGGNGRGNLRKNREDPAPTVRIVGIP